MTALECGICPHACRIAPGRDGRCRARGNRDGRIVCLTYGRLCAEAVDPVEKKPLYHFLPGTPIYSVATPGCNLSCLHCQNWVLSQSGAAVRPVRERTPSEIVARALRQRCPAVAYTYTEPLVSYEFVRDCCMRAHDAGLRNAWVTAAYIQPAPLQELLPFVDAANVDLKAFSDRFYRTVCGARLAPVLRALEQMRAAGIWIEITNLVIPTLNDSDAAFKGLCRWVCRRLGPGTPLHFSRFHPQHRLTHLPPTSAETLRRAAAVARSEGLRHVYLGNVDAPGAQDTHCVHCGARMVRRSSFAVSCPGLCNGCCSACGAAADGVWA